MSGVASGESVVLRGRRWWYYTSVLRTRESMLSRGSGSFHAMVTRVSLLAPWLDGAMVASVLLTMARMRGAARSAAGCWRKTMLTRELPPYA